MPVRSWLSELPYLWGPTGKERPGARRSLAAEEDLNLHLRSDEYRNLLLILEVALNQPEIRFDTISSSMGIEAIEKARGRTR